MADSPTFSCWKYEINIIVIIISGHPNDVPQENREISFYEIGNAFHRVVLPEFDL